MCQISVTVYFVPIAQYLKDVLAYRTMEPTVTCYMLGIVEYMGADILKVSQLILRLINFNVII